MNGLVYLIPILAIVFIISMKDSTVEGFEKSVHGFPEGYFKIRNRLNGRCLDVNGGSSEPGSRAVLFSCHQGHHQQWYVDSAGRLKNRLSNLCLTVSEGGTHLEINSSTGKDSQVWNVDSVGRVTSKSNGRFMTFDENSKDEIVPVYLWTSYQSPAQRWYFEKVEMPRQTVLLAEKYNGLSTEPLEIPNNRLDPSNNYTYQMWFKLNDPEMGRGSERHLLHKGTRSGMPRVPGLWLHSQKNQFKVSVSTSQKEEDFNVDHEIVPRKWTNVAVILEGHRLKFYIDGLLRESFNLKGEPDSSPDPVHIGMGRFGGELQHIEYSNFVLSEDQIRDKMQKTAPHGSSKEKDLKESKVKVSTDKPRPPVNPSEIRMDAKSCLQELEEERAAYRKLHAKLLKDREGLKKIPELQGKIKTLNHRIERIKIEAEIEKSKRCPPQEKCLPMADHLKCPTEKTVNDFDIRTHRDFYRYVKASKVQPCMGSKDANLRKELEACRSRFMGEQSGGAKDSSGHNIEMDHHYDIQNHRDFKKLMSRYIKKTQCDKEKQDVLSQKSHPGKTVDPNKYPIEKHPQYPSLMAKYAERKPGSCPPQYLPYLMRTNGTCAKMPIEQHPQYQGLMNRVACKKPGTCPTQYTRCKTECPPQKKISDFDIKNHPDFGKYVPKSQVKEMVDEEVSKRQRNIKLHPQYPALMNKYARRVPNTCPPQYAPHEPCPKVPSMDKYILKSQIPKYCQSIHNGNDQTAKKYGLTTDDGRVVPCPSNIRDYPGIDRYILKSQVKGAQQCLKHFR